MGSDVIYKFKTLAFFTTMVFLPPSTPCISHSPHLSRWLIFQGTFINIFNQKYGSRIGKYTMKYKYSGEEYGGHWRGIRGAVVRNTGNSGEEYGGPPCILHIVFSTLYYPPCILTSSYCFFSLFSPHP